MHECEEDIFTFTVIEGYAAEEDEHESLKANFPSTFLILFSDVCLQILC